VTSGRAELPIGLGLWSGFLDRLPARDAVAAVRLIEQAGIATMWLQEYSGVDPFIRAALYLAGTDDLTVALGVATIHARDPEAMVAAAATLQEAFPGRLALGLGASHRHLAESRGSTYARPMSAVRDYLAAMNAATGPRKLPPLFLGALGPRMAQLAGEVTAGLHSYFSPVRHTGISRCALGAEAWLAPSQMVACGPANAAVVPGVRGYLKLCLGMPNYRRNLERFGFTVDDFAAVSDRLVDALVIRDEPAALADRIAAHRGAGADHVVLQFVPPPHARIVLDRIADGLVDP
jgi:probable F420-dependent oxidoreductase